MGKDLISPKNISVQRNFLDFEVQTIFEFYGICFKNWIKTNKIDLKGPSLMITC